MTQNTQQGYKYSSLYFKENEAGVVEPLKVRILANDVSNLVQTGTHLRFIQTSTGKKRPVRIECLKKGYQNSTTVCPMDANERFDIKSKYWAWVIDVNDDNKLKYLELTYTMVMSIKDVMEAVAPLQPWYNLEIMLTKTGKKLETRYSVIPIPPAQPYDPRPILNALGYTNVPPMIGRPDTNPPILSLTYEEMVDFENGIYPWTKKKEVAPAVQQATQASVAPATATIPAPSSITPEQASLFETAPTTAPAGGMDLFPQADTLPASFGPDTQMDSFPANPSNPAPQAETVAPQFDIFE